VDERSLIARAVSGDAAAERELYDAHVDRIYRLAFRLTGDGDAARDITQDTFIRAFSRLGEFRGDSALGSWLHTIAFSVGMNAVRTARRREGRTARLDDGLLVPAAATRADPDLRERLARAIDGLPAGYRAVFVMHDVEGYTHEQIGAALGIASGTSKAQLFHARAKLRAQLADFREEWAS
jgi:RNA polymerase sigma-70 factor (ECF subfamily)